LESAQDLDASGCAFFASPPGFPEALERLLYQEWEQHEQVNGYQLKHEALFTTLDNVNRRNGEFLNIPVKFSDQAAFLTHASASCEQSITAFAFSTHATQSANGRSKPLSGSKASGSKASGSKAKASAARSAVKVFHATDTAWKGVWQSLMNASQRNETLPTIDDLVEKITVFHNHVTAVPPRFKIELSKAPLLKVLQLPKYKGQLNEGSVIDVEVAEWLEEMLESKVRVRNLPSGDRARKRPKGGEEALEESMEDAISAQELYAAVSQPPVLLTAASNKITQMNSTLNKMGTKVMELEVAEHRLTIKASSLDDRIRALESSALVALNPPWPPLIDNEAEMNSLRAQLASAKAHADQNAIVFGTLASALQQTRIVLETNSTDVERKRFEQISAPLFSQIINMVNNLWQWTTEQKLSIYGAFEDIPAFKKEQDKLNGDVSTSPD